MVLSVVFFLCGAGILIYSIVCDKVFLSVIGVLLMICSPVNLGEGKPQAIDVYRNNTELKVTYKICNGDTLSCDSTVVFKQKTI